MSAELREEFDPKQIMPIRGKLITKDLNFSIKPQDIDISRHLFDAYGNTETEYSAHYIIKLCQKKGSWAPFTYDEVEALYNESGYQNFSFNQLVDVGRGYRLNENLEFDYYPVGGGWIVKDGDNYLITTAFIEAAHRSRPASQLTSQ